MTNDFERNQLFNSMTGFFTEMRLVAEQYKKRLKMETDLLEIMKKQRDLDEEAIWIKIKKSLFGC